MATEAKTDAARELAERIVPRVFNLDKHGYSQADITTEISLAIREAVAPLVDLDELCMCHCGTHGYRCGRDLPTCTPSTKPCERCETVAPWRTR